MYIYLVAIHPVTILLVYFLFYFVRGFFLIRLESMLLLVQNEGPYLNPRPRYGKVRYKHTLINMRPNNKSKYKGRPKTSPRRPKYKRRRSVKEEKWGFVYQCMPLLDPDFSNYFAFNYK